MYSSCYHGTLQLSANHNIFSSLPSDTLARSFPVWGDLLFIPSTRRCSDLTLTNDHAAYRLGKEYLKGEIVAKDTAKAKDFLTQSAEAGNHYAQYALAKLCLEEHEPEQAHYWFTQSAAQGNGHAQFFLDRWDSMKAPSVMLAATRLLHHMGRVFQERTPIPSVPNGIQIDRKRLQQIREKKIALGHKPDDHEEQSQSGTSMSW